MSQAWKDLERRCCQALGGDRVLGNPGRRSGSDSNPQVHFSVEVKHGYQRPRLPAAWLQQAQRHGKAEGRPWLLVQAPKHSRRPLVTLDFWVFCEIAQKAGLIGTIEVE